MVDNKGGMHNMFKNTPLYTEDLTSWDVQELHPDNNKNFNTRTGENPDGEWPNFGEETDQGEIQYLGSNKADTNSTETWSKTIDGKVKETNIAYTPSSTGDHVNGQEGQIRSMVGRNDVKNKMIYHGGAGDDLMIGGAGRLMVDLVKTKVETWQNPWVVMEMHHRGLNKNTPSMAMMDDS